uniref:Uncharacterized protein n=1 Tax=Anguilla anguilla TaxID=7936 RepID=A0A0E9V0X2_ANGAN
MLWPRRVAFIKRSASLINPPFLFLMMMHTKIETLMTLL